MAFRFQDPGHASEGMRDNRGGDGNRLMGGIDEKRMPDDMGDFNQGPRPPFGRGRSFNRGEKQFMDKRDFGGFGRDDHPVRDRSPMQGRFDDDRFRRDEGPFPRRDERFGAERDMFREGRGHSDQFDSRYEDDRRMRPFSFGNAAPRANYKTEEMLKTNECEIIVVNKMQRAYGESIENRMKNLGILVDILFLKDEALLVRTIDDIARRGSLYAMVITTINETHRSVTLNILHGTPQEHRNMPLDDAMKLIARDFHDHMRNQRSLMDRDRLERGMYFGAYPGGQEMQFYLRLLADGRQLSIGELEIVHKFVSERIDKLKGVTTEAPTGTTAVPTTVSSENDTAKKENVDVGQKEQDLQTRIMNIMNHGTSGKDGTPVNPPRSTGANSNVPSNKGHSNLPQGDQGMDRDAPGPNQPSTYINFDNPSVQKALDSLMQSGPNLLKTLTTGGNSSTPQTSDGNKQQGPMGQRGLPNERNEMGNMCRGGMGPPMGRNMGNPDMKNMGLMDNRNTGPMDRNVGNPRMQQNMGSGPIPNMGNRIPFQDSMFGSGGAGMGNRQPYMGMGGPMGNQGRRY